MSLQRLSPSEVKKAAEETLSKPDLFDSEFGYFELGESYSLRRFKCALSLTGGRVVWALIGLAASTFATLRSGFLSGFLTLLTALALYLLWNFFFAAPKKLDETLRENLRAAKKQLIEERQKGTLAVRVVVNNYSKVFDQLQELRGQYSLDRSNWQSEKRDLEKQLEGNEGDLTRARENIEKLYRNYRQKHLSQTKEINSLKDQVLAEKTKNATPDLYGKIKEVYFKPTSDGLYITLRVHIGNRGADTTIQPFVLTFLLNGREYIALAEDNVTDYSIVRTIDKPLWPSFTRETEAEELTDLSEDNLKPLDRHGHREGWLRFRIPQLVAYMRGEGGELTLEIIDAIDRVVSIKVSPPWPQDGVIRFSRALQAEWDEAVKRSQEKQAEEVDSQESAPPDAS